MFDNNNDGTIDREEFERVAEQHPWVVKHFFVRYCTLITLTSKRKLEDEIKLRPPLGILLITMLQVAFYFIHKSEPK